MAIQDVLKGSSRHSKWLNINNITKYEADLFLVCGQSNAAGSTPVPNTVPYTTPNDVAFAVQYGNKSPQQFDFPFKNGSTPSQGWGQSNAWPHFAYQWFTDTGRRSVWLNFSVAGTCLRKESIPGTQQHWDVSDLSKCLVANITYTDGGETKTRAQMFADAIQAYSVNPKLRLGKRYVVWVQGEADANSYTVTSTSQYEERLNAIFDYMKTNMLIDHFAIFGLGRKGTDATQVATFESQSYAAFRNAQKNVADSRSDTTLVFEGAKELGTPFNTLNVDANFFHVSGMAYQADGVHLTSEGYRCMGRTGARNMALALGLM